MYYRYSLVLVFALLSTVLGNNVTNILVKRRSDTNNNFLSPHRYTASNKIVSRKYLDAIQVEILGIHHSDDHDLNSVLNQFRSDDGVEFVEVDQIITLQQSFQDLPTKDWGQAFIKAPVVPNREVVVAVLDTGVDMKHPDLQGLLVPGFNAINTSLPPQDGHGHGTHCTGTIVTALGAKNVKIMPIKILDDFGRGDLSKVAEAMNFALTNGAKITSNSWGGQFDSQILKSVFENTDLLHVFAAGNDGVNIDTVMYSPAGFQLPNSITVAANDSLGRKAAFSNYSKTKVHVSAPGVNILSLKPGGGQQYMSGTSMATPHVSAAAALVWANFPQKSNKELIDIIKSTITVSSNLTPFISTGGYVNLEEISKLTPVEPDDWSNCMFGIQFRTNMSAKFLEVRAC